MAKPYKILEEQDPADNKESKAECSGEVCRICYGGSSAESLLTPCSCKGTLAKVHKTCLQTWLESQAADQCEICKHAFTTVRKPKGFQDWLVNNNTQVERQNLISDIISMLLLTPLMVFGLWLCTEGAIHYSNEGFTTWESAGLVCVTIFFFFINCIWITLLVRHHCKIWKKWKSQNFHVKLILNDHNSSCQCCTLHNQQEKVAELLGNEVEAGVILQDVTEEITTEPIELTSCFSEQPIIVQSGKSSPT